MSKLLNRSLKRFLIYAGIILACSIPVYYLTMSRLWQYELDEHNVIVSPEAGREDSYLIITAVTSLTALFFILLMGGFILLNRRISRRLWQPFYRSLGQIQQFDLNAQQKVVFEPTDIDEFTALNQSLDKLIAGNIAAYNQQKEFADNASHELQTPLAIIQSKLDLLLQSRSLTDEQFAIIEEANKALARVTRINKNLLLLAKIENSQFMEKEAICLTELLEHAIAVFTNFSEGKQHTLQTNIAPGIQVEGNKILVEIMLNNLITNAIRHTEPGGTINIRLTASMLSVSNTGATPLQQEQLFKRFGATSSHTPGTGLGLALVKQIGQRYGWQIAYTFKDSLHTFSINF